MLSPSPDLNRLEAIKQQLSELEEACAARKEKLEQLRQEALQKKFDLNALDNPGFFQKYFGKLKEKKEAAWQAYRTALAAQDQAQMDYDAQTAQRMALRAEYQALLSAQSAKP